MSLLVSSLATDADIEVVRVIRNAGRQWMTEDTSEVSTEQQRNWWQVARWAADTKLVVYREKRNPRIIGYGLISRRNGGLVVSLAVAPEHQGVGYGTEIYRDLASRASEPVMAKIRADNKASIRAVEKAGYKFFGRDEKVVYYVGDGK